MFKSPIYISSFVSYFRFHILVVSKIYVLLFNLIHLVWLSLRPSICCFECHYFIPFYAEPELEPGTARLPACMCGVIYVVWILVSSLLRPFRFLYSAIFKKKCLIPWEWNFRHHQTGRGGGEANLHPDPEITEGECPNSWDAKWAPQTWL